MVRYNRTPTYQIQIQEASYSRITRIFDSFPKAAMSLNDLKPVNTMPAQTTALAAFERYLSSEGTSMAYVRTLIVADHARAEAMLVTIMDKFDVHLAFQEGKRGKPLSGHSVTQYYRQVKCWLMDQYPLQCSQGRTLEQPCIKRDSGGFTKKASPCTKDDLKKMMMYLYTTASTSTDYQDAGLLCLLWDLFGRASDLTFVRKQQLSISAGNVFFIRFIRVKTSEEQALSLFLDDDYATCPLLALGLALITQVAPCAHLLSHLPDEVKNVPLEVSASVPLLELLGDPQTPPTMSSAATTSSSKPRHVSSAIGIHA
ncbi:Hypothetical protein PHPALM_6376 [Phytophthora palmivora]|uniref:Uncharacterized protein n=1 Tax=Phytophthora palmivora TaxID=4796 RepID=A0A2P4YF12_9STRA|nr:Hypothetical protein PHPALM_6376 [Phytophthora palmivora]